MINIDESWISETEYSRRMWCPAKSPATITDKSINPRLALIAALDSDGKVYFALTHAITDSDVIASFLKRLCDSISVFDPNWRDNSVILLDGARYHTSEETRSTIKKLRLPVIFSGPYSYSTAPIEMLFGGLKNGTLLQYGESTGKR